MHIFAYAVMIALLGSAGVSAQETRVTHAGHMPPDAGIAQLDWLIGQWEGEGIGDNRAMESWLPPTGNTMVGTFVQTYDTGAIQFTEHMYLMEEEGSLVLRLKHFNADLTGWEERDGMLTFRLVEIEPCAAYFGGLTLRCNGEEGLLVAVRMRSEGDAINELVFRFDKAAESAVPSAPCANAATTLDLNDCHAAVLERAATRQAQYLAAATLHHADDPEVVRQISEADEAYAAYGDAECGAIYQNWIEGSIRNVMALTCLIELTDRRTHTIWKNWLTYMDSTPPVLPEPGPTR